MENPKLSQQIRLVSASADYRVIFIVPLVVAVVITQLILHQLYPFDKYLLEDVALIVTGGFCLLCLSRFAFRKDKFFLWAAAMMLVLFIREVHPPGSSGGVYLGLLVLFYIAYKRYYLFADYIRNRGLVTLLGTGFFTYFLAVTTDQRFWKFIPAEKIFHTTLEESLELLGHVIIGCSLFLATRENADS